MSLESLSNEPSSVEKEVSDTRNQIFGLIDNIRAVEFRQIMDRKLKNVKNNPADDELLENIMDQITDSAKYMVHLESGRQVDEIADEEADTKRVELFTEHKIYGAPDDDRGLMSFIADNKLTLTGSDGYVYQTEELLHSVSHALSGMADIRTVTRTGGLRDKVQKILDLKEVYKKHSI
tara:strand:+ start:331 stop:864 length:534 start_codon:yes stop_codon:yes gene_type:complete